MDKSRSALVYHTEVGKKDVLTAKKEAELARLIERGDGDARRRFIESNLRLVINIAGKYSKGDEVLKQDLIQQGNEGLVKAADRFDVNRGVRFSTHATWWVRQAITRYLNQSSFITLPVHRKQDVNRLIKIANECGVEDDDMYTGKSIRVFIDEFNKRYPKKNNKEYTSDDIKIMLENYHRLFVVSMSLPLFDEGGETLVDGIEDTNTADPSVVVDKDVVREEVKKSICKLSDRHLFVVVKRFDIDGEGEHTLEQIGKMIGVTRERVRQILAEAIGRLKNIMAHLEEGI